MIKKHLQAELRVRDRTEALTPSNVRALLSSSDRELRRAAWQFRRSVAAEQLTVLEPIKRARADFRIAQARLLGYSDVLDATLDDWRLSREGYDAVGMQVARGRDFFDTFYRWKQSALNESTFEEADLSATAVSARSEWLGLDRVFVALHAAPGLSGDFKGVLTELVESRVLFTDTRATLSPSWFTLPHYGGGLPLVHVPYHRTLDDFCAAAHELGHACHTTVVARKLGALAASDESLCYSETFSLAFEIAALNQALIAASSDEERRFWRAAVLEQAAHFVRTLPIRARFDELVYLQGRPYNEAWAEAHAALSPAWLPCPSAEDCTWVLATSSEDLPFHGHAYALAYLSAYAAYLQPDSTAIATLLENPWEPIDRTYESILELDLKDEHAFDRVWRHLADVLSDD
jgi:oligoendopeptidase F